MAVVAQGAFAQGANGSSQWATSVSGGYNAAGTMSFGATSLTAAISSTTNGCGSATGNQAPNSSLVGLGAGPFYTPAAPADAVGVIQCLLGQNTAVRTVTFNRPVIAPVFNINNLDASTLTFSPGSSGGVIQLETLSKDPPLNLIGGTLLQNSVNQGNAGCSNTPANPNNNSGCGSFRMTEAGGPVSSFTMTNTTKPGLGSDGWFWTLWYPTAPLTKAFSPSPIPAGGRSALTFTIANPSDPGQPTLAPLDFTDVLPPGVTVADSAVGNNGNCGSPTLADSGGGALGAGDAGVTASNISVAAGATCAITVNVTSSVPGNYINDSNNLSTQMVNLVPNASTPLEVYPAADLAIEKTVSPSPVVPGKQATYSLKVTNKGPSTAGAVNVSDPLPSGLSFVSGSPGCSEVGGTVTCSGASLAAGASRTFTITVALASSLDRCPTNVASVAGALVDPQPDNNSAPTCAPLERQVDLAITKTPSRTQLPAGGQVMYTIVVKNNGPSDATGVTLRDPLAAGLSLLSADPSQGSCSTAAGNLSCSLGGLASGGSAQVLLTAEVGPRPARITNTATVRAEETETDRANNADSATVVVPPGPTPPAEPPPPPSFDLAVTKKASRAEASIGQSVRYTIVVVNRGPAAAPKVALADTLNAPVRVSSVKTTAGTCGEKIPLRCSLGAIEAGGSVKVTVVAAARRERCGQRNAASVTGAGTDRSPADNLDTVTVTECARKAKRPLLVVRKVANADNARPGAVLGYTITVRNRGKGDARNVKVCDRPPTQLRILRTQPGAAKGNAPCWRIRRLAAGAERVFRVTAQVADSGHGVQRNLATVSAANVKGTRTDAAAVRVRPLPETACGSRLVRPNLLFDVRFLC